MYFWDLEKLERWSRDNNLYDLYAQTGEYKFLSLKFHVVTPEEESRIDVISNNLFGSPEWAGELLRLNNIINPLNIKQDQIIAWSEVENLSSLRIEPNDVQTITERFNNKAKSEPDPVRKQFLLSQGVNIPVTMNNKNINPVKIKGNTIVIGG